MDSSFIFSVIVWPIMIIGIIVFIASFIKRHIKGGEKSVSMDKNWYLRVALSKEDGISQVFALLSIVFLGITLFALNRDFGNLVSWSSIVLLVSIVALYISYRFKFLYTIAFGLIGIILWWVSKAISWIEEGNNVKSAAIFSVLCLIVLSFYLIGRLHEKETRFKRVSVLYFVLSIISITVVLFILSTRSGLELIQEVTKGKDIIASWQLTISFIVSVVAFAALLVYTKSKNLISSIEFAALTFLATLFGLKVFLPEQDVSLGSLYSWNNPGLSPIGVLWATVYNFVLFFELLGIILLGYIRQESWLINLGAIFLFILIIVKYFDWFFDSMDKSIFFIIAGILMFVVGWFMEKGRRKMVSKINIEKVNI